MQETPKAAAAYAEYAAMGAARSLRKMAEKYSNPSSKLRQFSAWSTRYNWQERVKQHDAAMAAEIERIQLAAIEDMNRRQADLGVEQTRAALQHIAALMADDRFGSQASVMLLKLAIDTERTARGVPSSVQRQEVSVSGELTISDARTALAARIAALTGQPAAG